MVPTYFKRYRMEINLSGRPLPKARPPDGYRLLAWDSVLLDAHARVKYLSFRDEIDAHVFPCLGELDGCTRLMREIAAKPGFLPGATWLAVFDGSEHGESEFCGTIQGIRARDGIGSVQNLGIVPSHRDRGVGTTLLQAALLGFRRAGLNVVSLEVTAENAGAIRLYRRWGFSTVKTLYKAAEVVYS
ncbi:MAG: GNAT family N-acetyltransferase [Pirellulales bacterium]|nr:GNAT family N-acetyltransferase [Pirellulales bacterium]